APAVRGRVWRRLLVAGGAPAGQLSARHTDACDRLVTDWHGQGPVHVPGPCLVRRREGRVHIEPHPRVE
ncbi:TilS substrate-binding domain-containing protein, partial [Nostocoides japonicum]|uniref:TilS substrate-binding domain-containing protein n=1 Tax=Nostocoides japonicum TaxID=99481 RepID=UPI00065BF2E1